MFSADLILTGASFFPGLGLNADMDFITILGNRIQAAGKGEAWKEYAGEKTRIIEMTKDQLVVPGFHDGHLHVLMSALQTRYVDLGAARTEEEAAEMMKAFADTIPDEEWVIGLNWYHLNWQGKQLPTKKSLDSVLPDRPAFLINTEVHGAWVNSEALKRTGIGMDTPDPPYGQIYRFPNGEASGYLNETAMGLAAAAAFRFPIETEQNMIVEVLKTYAAEGVTAVQDMRPELGYDLGQYVSFQRLEQEERLNVRIFSAANLFDPVERVKADMEKYNGSLFQIRLLKQYLDGVPTTHTAMVTEPYLDAPEEYGEPINDLERMQAAVMAAHRNGLSVKLHCCGDGAVMAALDMYEAAVKKYGRTKSRHAVEHAEVLRESDIARFKKLGVTASMQPEHMTGQVESWKNYPYVEKYSKEKLSSAWCFRSMLDGGINVAFGSDCPVVPIRPLTGIYRAVTRKFDDGEPIGGMNPGQRISVAEALHCYTFGSAFGANAECGLGTLEPGKLADLAVIDRNILLAGAEEIREARIILTIMDGKVTYER